MEKPEPKQAVAYGSYNYGIEIPPAPKAENCHYSYDSAIEKPAEKCSCPRMQGLTTQIDKVLLPRQGNSNTIILPFEHFKFHNNFLGCQEGCTCSSCQAKANGQWVHTIPVYEQRYDMNSGNTNTVEEPKESIRTKRAALRRKCRRNRSDDDGPIFQKPRSMIRNCNSCNEKRINLRKRVSENRMPRLKNGFDNDMDLRPRRRCLLDKICSHRDQHSVSKRGTSLLDSISRIRRDSPSKKSNSFSVESSSEYDSTEDQLACSTIESLKGNEQIRSLPEILQYMPEVMQPVQRTRKQCQNCGHSYGGQSCQNCGQSPGYESYGGYQEASPYYEYDQSVDTLRKILYSHPDYVRSYQGDQTHLTDGPFQQAKDALKFVQKITDVNHYNKDHYPVKRSFQVIPLLQDQRDGGLIVKILNEKKPQQQSQPQGFRSEHLEKFLQENSKKNYKDKSSEEKPCDKLVEVLELEPEYYVDGKPIAKFVKELKNGKLVEILQSGGKKEKSNILESDDSIDIVKYIYQTLNGDKTFPKVLTDETDKAEKKKEPVKSKEIVS